MGEIRNTPSTSRDAPDYNLREYDWVTRVKKCPIYEPSIEEFEDPLGYIESIAEEASEYGICKIVSPLSNYKAPNMVLSNGFKFMSTVQPLQAGENGQISTCEKGSLRTLEEFEVLARNYISERYGGSSSVRPAALLEREFWNELLKRKNSKVEYGINLEGSAFSNDPEEPLSSSLWNLKTFAKLPQCLLRHVEIPIAGVTQPMLYVGMLFATFAWHVEDNYLYSINFHHTGEPKTWYGVPGKHASSFETVAQNEIFKNQEGTSQPTNVADILAKKTTMFPPNILLDNGVPVYKAIQSAGEFIITFPRAYHSGFSNGFNVGEAVNFATYDWLEFGKLALTNYAKGSTPNIISYDEIILKECLSFGDAALTNIQKEMAVSCSVIIRMNNIARSCIDKLPPKSSIRILRKSGKSVHCIKCGQDCYLSYIKHKESKDPICLFHEWKDFKDCSIYHHRDINEIEKQAYKFEDDKEVEEKVQDQLRKFIFDVGSQWMVMLLMNVAARQNH